MTTRIAFVGLGTMGYPMAGHLKKSGRDVTVYNRTVERAQQWVEQYGGEYRETPREAAEDADLVFSCVGNDDDVREVAYGSDGVIIGLKPGAIYVDHTTTSADLAHELSEQVLEAGSHFLDAPLSGGQLGAETGQLTIMVGGDGPVFQKAKPVLEIYARCLKLIGGVGSGQLCKMVNQICIAGLIESLAEGIFFAKKQELDIEKVMEVISQGAAQSWQLDNRHKTMINGEYNFGFAVDWMLKDLNIVKDESNKLGITLPAVELVYQFYEELREMGGGRWDTSSLLSRFEKDF